MSNFTNPSDSNTLPPRAMGTVGKSVLAADLRITGDIISEGSVEVMGEIEGSVTATTLLVSHEGSIKGTIKAGSIDMRGKMQGKIESGSLTMRSAAQVKADVHYTSLSIESGAQIEGSFKRKKA